MHSIPERHNSRARTSPWLKSAIPRRARFFRGSKQWARSYGLEFQDGAVIGCGVVSGEAAPYYNASGVNISDSTKICQSLANRVETQAIERYRPSVIVWGSTEEHGSIVDHTASGDRVLDAGSSAWKSVMLQRMDDRVVEFLDTGAKVILLAEPPPLQSGTSVDAIDVDYEQMNAAPQRGCGTTSASCRSGQPCGPGVSSRAAMSSRGGRSPPETNERGSGNRPRHSARFDPLLADLIALGGEMVGAKDRCGGEEPLMTSRGVVRSATRSREPG